MRAYLTSLGREGSGRAVNARPEDAMKFKHDLLLRAVEERLDVFMLCGSMNSKLREGLYREVTGFSFADSLKEVLKAKCAVSILVWDVVSESSLAPSIIKLVEEAEHSVGWGKLDLRISGTMEGDSKLPHFLICKSRDNSGWLMRIEEPHQRAKTFSKSDPPVPAAIVFGEDEAKEAGPRMLGLFFKLFDSVPDKAVMV